jgi:subtilisin inhibitor-like
MASEPVKDSMKPLLTAVVCLATLAAGCGSKGTAASSPPSDIRLTITIAPGFIANPHVTRYRLTCAPPTGTVPDASRACRALQADAGLLAAIPCPLAPDMGSELVRGTANGAPVNLRLSSSTACANRWQRLATALGIAG